VLPAELEEEEGGMAIEARKDGAVSLAERHPYVAGAVLAFVTIGVFAALPEPRGWQFAAVLLAIIAGAYVGFAARDGRHSANLIEGAVCLAFGGLALAGLWVGPLALVAGYVAHGFWDLVHHRHGPQADIPAWWVPFCAVYDWLVGGFLLLRWQV
jgi:hypothetical protein